MCIDSQETPEKKNKSTLFIDSKGASSLIKKFYYIKINKIELVPEIFIEMVIKKYYLH